MRDQFKQKNLDQNSLKQFVLLVKTIDDTPTLIQRIAENREFLFFCAAIVNQDGDFRFHDFSQKLKKETRRHYLSYEKIIDKLMPVATALGISTSDADAIQIDFYQLLGVSKKSSLADIKKAYHSKARETHPDMQKGENEKFVSVLAAYNVLSDQTQRHQYDLSRKMANNWSWSEKIEQGLPDNKKSGLSNKYLYSFIIIILILVTVSLIVDQMNHEISINSHAFNVSVKKNLPSATDLKDLKDNGTKVHDSPENNHAQSMNLLTFDETHSQESILQIERAEKMEYTESKDLTTSEQPLTIDNDKFIEKNKSTRAHLTIVPKYNKHISKRFTDNHRPAKNQKHLMASSVTAKTGNENQEPIVQIARDSEIKGRNEIKSSMKEKAPGLSESELTRQPETSADIAEHITVFLNLYTKSYENKDIDEFMKLFTDNAVENGKPVKSLLPIYQRNFEFLNSIKYTIDLKKYAWDLALDKIQISGDFYLSWRKNNDTQTHDYYGSIKLILVPHAEHSFQVENLSYKFAD
jgi:curved DNA-binding protein CbpA